MAYDIAVVDSDFMPVAQATLSMDEHYALMAVAGKWSCELLIRMHDCFEMVGFTPDEVGSLADEVNRLIADTGIARGDRMSCVLREIREVCDYAATHATGILTIPD